MDSLKSNSDQASQLPDDLRLVVIQRNPNSGSGRGHQQLLLLIRRLRQLGFAVRMFSSREHLDRFLSCPANAANVRCLVAAGGDGTVANMVSRHPGFPLAVLPLGTENLMARYLKIPGHGSVVADLIAAGHTKQFDTGFVADQRFLIMVSIGVDADVVRQLHGARQGNISKFSYLRPILSSFRTYGFPELSVSLADGTFLGQGTHVIITNVPAYGFRMPFSPEADPHDGLLNVRILQRAGRLKTLTHALRIRTGFLTSEVDVIRFQASEVFVSSTHPDVPVQFDGDPAGNCPVCVRIDPGSMTMVVHEKQVS